MLRRSPEFQKRLDLQAANSIEGRALKIEQRRFNRRRYLHRALATVAIFGVGLSSYASDVKANQEIQASASIAVRVEGPALDENNSNKALVFIDGFNAIDASFLTQQMGKVVQPVIDGQLWSVGYNNAFLEKDEIAKQIIDTVHTSGVDEIALVGYSAGGDIAMQVQEYIHEHSNIVITSDILISVPDGAKALRPARQDEIDLVEKFAWIPGIQYSTLLRFIGEMAFRADRYNTGTIIENAQNFMTTAGQVNDSLCNNKLPGAWLMFDQVLAIEHADLKQRISTIGKLPKDRVRPAITYVGTAIPGYDYMVDDKKSSKSIGSYAHKAGVPFLNFSVPGAVHSRPDIANDAYMKAFAAAKTAIQTSLKVEASRASLHRITSRYYPPPPKN